MYTDQFIYDNMHRLKYISFITLGLLLVFSSCKPLFRKDRSLTFKEYQLHGMPDINMPWPEDKLMKAHVAIGSVRMRNFYALPVKNSRRSGAVFSHLLSPDNLSFLDDTTASLRDKAFQIQAYWSFISDLGLIYNDNFSQKQYYSRELTDIFVYQLYVRKKMFELADRIDKASDPLDVGMQKGRLAISESYVFLIEGMIGKQEKTGSFTPRQLRKMDRAVLESVKENSKNLDPESRGKLLEAVKKQSEKGYPENVKKSLAEMLKFLKQ